MFTASQRLSRWRTATSVTLGFLLLAGCAVKRDAYNVPKIELPQRFLKSPTVVAPGTEADAAPNLLAEQAGALNQYLGEWWRLLGSAELNALMDRVLANNPDLRVATLRMAQLQARMDVASAGGKPEINIPFEARNEAPAGGTGSTKVGEPVQSQRTYKISLRGDWRPDLWGEFAALFDAAQLQLWRATFLRDDVQRIVVANVVATYVEYLSLNDRLRVARETDLAVSEMLSAVAARLEAGDATAIEYEQQKAAVYQVRATIPVLQQQREVVFNRLSSQAGSVPAQLRLSDKGLDSISFPSVLPGVPAALLLRRPDVRAVEAQLLVADADIDTARARILPPLDLTSQIGYGSHHFSDLFQPQNLAWNFIANLSANLFDGGKRSKEVDFTQAVHEELVETYVRVIYEATREVDDALSAIREMETRMRLQRISTDAAYQAWTFSQEAYRAGAVDYLVVLDTERTYTRNLDDWIGARMERYRSLSGLFSALGGGVAPGIALPGDGDRPLALKVETDLGGVLKPAGAGLVPGSVAVASPVPATASIATNAMQTVLEPVPAGQAVAGVLTLSLGPALVQRPPLEGVDWPEDQWREPGDQWLVEMTGLYERSAVEPAWRDLNERFAEQVKGRVLVPHRHGLVTNKDEERASWYRVYIARNPSNEAAQKLCSDLRARQQRCRVMLVKAPNENDDNRKRDPVFIEVKPDAVPPAPAAPQLETK